MTEPDNWNKRCANSIREEKHRIEKYYGIRIGQTEIYCARCGKSWGFRNHNCKDLRLKDLDKFQEERKKEEIKSRTSGNENSLEKIIKVGRQKAAILLEVPETTLKNWMDRGRIPVKFHQKASNL